MNKNFIISVIIFVLTLSSCECVQAAEAEDRADFQEWLQKNNQSSSNIPPPPFLKTPPPPAVKKTVKKSPSMVYVNGSGEVMTPPMSFTENQKVMLNSAPPSPPPSPESEEAFSSLLQQNVPLSPEQIVKIRQQMDVQQRAAAIPANIPPKPVSSTLMINLAPGTTPPAIRLSQGYISSLVFVDSTGAPWPIASFDIGAPQKLGPPQWDGKSNVLLLQAVSPY
ncbi:MAG TPA: DotH/IcmK family type IV secretion protein, partial [Gammaproteobacteria bacterium]|nr:DotH/IcmK family type IV secretion protein [Gammaproteobacteria bacterium]